MEAEPFKPREGGPGVGMPAGLYLEQFGSLVWDAFGSPPYLVGSAGYGKQWRDVDVRLILDDEEYDAMFGKFVGCPQHNSGKWVALCMAFSELGRKLTGLPIDFQIQRRTEANAEYQGMRSALGMIELRTVNDAR